MILDLDGSIGIAGYPDHGNDTAELLQHADVAMYAAQWHRDGNRLSVAGNVSTAYLKALPVDELKVDRSFVGHMDDSSSDAVIVRSTIDLGHNLGLRVVAEGGSSPRRPGGSWRRSAATPPRATTRAGPCQRPSCSTGWSGPPT